MEEKKCGMCMLISWCNIKKVILLYLKKKKTKLYNQKIVFLKIFSR